MPKISITNVAYDTSKHVTTVTFLSEGTEYTRVFEGKPTMQEVINFYDKSENVEASDATTQTDETQALPIEEVAPLVAQEIAPVTPDQILDVQPTPETVSETVTEPFPVVETAPTDQPTE